MMNVAASHRWLHEEIVEGATEETSGFKQASLLQLILTGTLFGLVHVLTGPDHLSALATLSAGTSWRSFSLGIRWGCGHSIGLIVMAIVFIALDGKLDFSVLNVVTDVIAGVFMIGLGLYGVLEGVKKSRQSKRRGISRRYQDISEQRKMENCVQ
uniref:Nickel/cobalt efflux system n=1 Tax=Peronospora matthiolae TaxID=2874970 RepID=A0AAV1TD50_9STRA